MSAGAIIVCCIMAFWFGYALGGNHAIRLCDKLDELRKRK